MKKNAVDRLE